MQKENFPTRINKFLAMKGYATRRGADELVAKGKVKINGRPAKLGDKVNEDDHVEVSISKAEEKEYTYLAYYKPRGVITHSPQEGEKEVRDIVPIKGLFPVGRLDKDSEGLMILTNDGRITDKMLNPKYEHEKEYVVKTDKPLTPRFLKLMGSGVNIEGYKTKPAKVKQIDNTTFRVVLTEGKKHQIRRMCASLGYTVRSLKRVRIGNVKLGNLNPGEWRQISFDSL